MRLPVSEYRAVIKVSGYYWPMIWISRGNSLLYHGSGRVNSDLGFSPAISGSHAS